MYKICSKCKEQKSVGEFNKKVTNKDGLQDWCKCCRCEQLKEYRKYRKANPDKYLKRVRTEKQAMCEKRYRSSNRDKINNRKAKRRAAKLNATPMWLTIDDFQSIQELYTIAKMFELYTGQEYHVDHIVPLQGENVCGLHVPWNLQVLSATDNLTKSNKFTT
jgi:hypothetical protein